MTRDLEEVRSLLEGPVASIPTPFLETGDVDFEGVRRLVEAAIASGSTTTFLTYGDAHLEMLDAAEIRMLTRTAADQSRGRSLVVGVTGLWSTRHAVEYARFAREAGADALIVTIGLVWNPYEGNDLVAHHRAIAAELPVMLAGYSSMELLAGLEDEPRVFAYKSESAGASREVLRRFGDRYVVMGGGLLWLHWQTFPFGCRSFMSPWPVLDGGVASRYWDLIQAGRADEAGRLVNELDLPFYELSKGYPAGFQATWRATLELQGRCRRFRRAPLLSLTDPEVERLAGELQSIGMP